MTREELLKHCKYYKGEEENPFEGQNNNKALFWNGEQMFVREAVNINNDMLDVYVGLAKDVVERQKRENKHTIMTDDNVSIIQKAIIMFLETLFAKWMYGDASAIMEY